MAAGRDTDGELMGRAVMVAGCVAAGENSFSELCVRADGIIAAREAELVDAILDVTKARARVASSSALAMRQGILYGRCVGRALERAFDGASAADERFLVEERPGTARLFAEALRISARLAAARQAPDEALVDFVTQDALLEKFGLAEVACALDPVELAAALKADELQRSNRCMIPLPLGFGRVRFTSLEDDMIAEHLGAWCKSRRKLAAAAPARPNAAPKAREPLLSPRILTLVPYTWDNRCQAPIVPFVKGQTWQKRRHVPCAWRSCAPSWRSAAMTP